MPALMYGINLHTIKTKLKVNIHESPKSFTKPEKRHLEKGTA